jgi:membrane-associated phospholipid phosphatase
LLRETPGNVRSDYVNFYRWQTTSDLLLAVAGGSILANTSLDEDFRDWVQDDVRSTGTDNFASFWKPFGAGETMIPGFVALSLVTNALGDRPLFDCAGDFSDRVARAYGVGAPAVLFMQALLGGSRPGEGVDASYWRPFDDDNAVSGHAFVGAVPFITAARMTDRPLVSGLLYFCSTLPAWSRVDDDAHFLSQAGLGWWMAYLACRSIDQTELDHERQFALTPMMSPDMTGAMLVVRR